ncbi:MAG: RnfABCDGE type electron transport complex subunit G [Spirochaetales bacterium]|nr:RnfABCDGE type electron transport complex subunit G [Spirochaetales bacterium]
MKKLESTLSNMFFVLTAIALISAAALAFTYDRTKPILDEAARRRQIAAIAEVVVPFDNAPVEEAIVSDSYPGVELYPATRDGARVGTAVRSFSAAGYGGDLVVMVGFDSEGRVTGSTVLQHAETPGLGAKITEESFRAQFVGMRPGVAPLAVRQDGGLVDAITAATISSRAFVEAINLAWRVVDAALPSVPDSVGSEGDLDVRPVQNEARETVAMAGGES